MDEPAHQGLNEAQMDAFNHNALELASGNYLACLFRRKADGRRYGDLEKQFVTDSLNGGSSYPKDLEAAAALFKG